MITAVNVTAETLIPSTLTQNVTSNTTSHSQARISTRNKKAPSTLTSDFFIMVDSITPRTSDLFCDKNDEGNLPFAACHQNIQGPRSNITYHTKERAPKNSFTLIHQNIRGINGKLEELQEFFSSNNLYPHALCFSEHHLRDEVYSIGIDNYVLGSCFS